MNILRIPGIRDTILKKNVCNILMKICPDIIYRGHILNYRNFFARYTNFLKNFENAHTQYGKDKGSSAKSGSSRLSKNN